MTLDNYPSEASIMVAKQLKIVNQIDAFTISATRNIQYVFKKLACLIGFVGLTGVYLLDFFCSGIQFNLLLSPYPCFISLLYLDLYVLGDDALIS